MSSTSEKQLRKFFDKKLAPTAFSLRKRGIRFFETGPTPADSWYVRVPADLPEFVEVEAHTAERDLRAMWEAQGLPELAKLARDFMKLAADIELKEDESGDVSPFMYVMY